MRLTKSAIQQLNSWDVRTWRRALRPRTLAPLTPSHRFGDVWSADVQTCWTAFDVSKGMEKRNENCIRLCPTRIGDGPRSMNFKIRRLATKRYSILLFSDLKVLRSSVTLCRAIAEKGKIINRNDS